MNSDQFQEALYEAMRGGGDRTAITIQGLQVFGTPSRGRGCGSCVACCVQVPVVLSDYETKPANERCRHLCSKGCRIYARRPRPCVAWSCRWLFDPDTAELRRPDQAGYVIDSVPDTVILNGTEPVSVVQVWCDPARRDAHRDPALRRYLATLAERHGLWAIVRWSSADGVVLIPPSVTGEDDWIEHASESLSHDALDAKLAEAGVTRPRFAMGAA